jgi:hypothetical protein
MHAQDGILYVATGKSFVAEAETSARSAKLHMPGVPLALVSDVGSPSVDFDMGIPLADARRNWADKIRGMLASPFTRTLFLDADTFVLHPIDHLFELLDRFDIAAAFEPAHGLYPIPPAPTGFAEMNTGVVLFNNTDQVRAVFETWLRLFDEETADNVRAGRPGWHDQLAFTRAVYSSELRFLVLPPEFNCLFFFPQAVSGPVYLAHGRLKDPSAYAKSLAFLNQEQGVRLFNPNPRRLPSLIFNTVKLFRRVQRK